MESMNQVERYTPMPGLHQWMEQNSSVAGVAALAGLALQGLLVPRVGLDRKQARCIIIMYTSSEV